MPTVISLVGAKGGTLKTASSAAIAHLLAQTDNRVLMIDADPQGDLTKRSGFNRVAEPLRAEPVPVVYEGAGALDLWLLRSGRSQESFDLAQMRRQIGRSSDIEADLVVIDTPPALGPITIAAIEASDLIVVGIRPGREGLEGFTDVVQLANRYGQPLIRGLISDAKPGTVILSLSQDHLDDRYPGLRFGPYVPNEVDCAMDAFNNRPSTVGSPHSRSAVAYLDVTAEIIGLLGIEQKKGAVA